MATLAQLTGWLLALGIPKDDGYLAPAANGETRRYFKGSRQPRWTHSEVEPGVDDQRQFVMVTPFTGLEDSPFDFSSGQVGFRAESEGVIEAVYFAESYGGSTFMDDVHIPESLPQLQGLFELFRQEWIKFEQSLVNHNYLEEG